MPRDGLHVFDLDGTLLRVNSFQHISRILVMRLVQRRRFGPACRIGIAWVKRRTGSLSHLEFKRLVVGVFERNLSEEEKQEIVGGVVHRHVNQAVLDVFRRSPNRVVSTAAPYAFAHRMAFLGDAVLISALDPSGSFPDPGNSGPAKLANLQAYLGTTAVKISAFYTDSYEDASLIDAAVHAFMVTGESVDAVK